MRYVKKTAKVIIGIAARALGDVVRNRESRPPQLFRIAIEMSFGQFIGDVPQGKGHIGGSLPDV